MSSEQRQAYRCPIPAELQFAELHLGRAKYAIRLINESTGGYLAAAERSSAIAANTSGILKTGSGWYRVQIVRCERRSDHLELGITRLGEYRGNSEKLNWGQSLRQLCGQFAGRLGAGLLGDHAVWVGIGAILLLMVCLVGSVLYLRANSKIDVTKSPLVWSRLNAPEASTTSIIPLDASELGHGDPRQGKLALALGQTLSASGEAASKSVTAKVRSAVRDLVAQFEPLGNSATLARLKLSDQQRIQLHDLREDAERQILALTEHAQGSGEDLAKRASAILDRAQQDCRRMLTSEQQKVLATLQQRQGASSTKP